MPIVSGWDTENLITWAQVQTLAGATVAKTETQGLWNFLVQASSKYARRYCSREFSQAARTLYAKPWPVVYLPEGPASAVQVYLDYNRAFPLESALDPLYYGLRTDGTLEFYMDLPEVRVPCLKITYTGGFAEIPQDVVQAVFEHAAWGYTRVSTRTVGQRLTGQDGYNLPVAFENPPYNVTNILGTYRLLKS